MRSIFNHIFSGEYAHANSNPIQLSIYRLAHPFVLLFQLVKLSPNNVTTLSLIFTITAFFMLIFVDNTLWFVLFWALSVLMDFSDGPLARMMGKVSKHAFRYDHMSDIFKLVLIMFGVAIRHDELIVWLCSSIASFCFVYYCLLNHEVSYVTKLLAKQTLNDDQDSKQHSREQEPQKTSKYAWLKKYGFLYAFAKSSRTMILTLNGHSLLVFFAFAFEPVIVVSALIYISLICLLGIKKRILSLISLPRP